MMAGTKRKSEAAPERPRDCIKDEASVAAQLAALKHMSVVELKTAWQRFFSAPALNNSRNYLELRPGYRIQELALGGLARQTSRTLDLLADEIDGKIDRQAIIADARNPVVGARLLREWDGAEHSVTVMKDGFDWQGRKFKSLPAVARAITGAQWTATASPGCAKPEGTSDEPPALRPLYPQVERGRARHGIQQPRRAA